MELLPPVGWSDVARQAGVSEFRSEIALLRADVTAEISDLRSEVRGHFPKLVAMNIASMTALVGLVLAALQLG